MQPEKTRTIFVLLTEHSDLISKVFKTMIIGKYTHSSIGLEEYNHIFFSFVTKDGFHIERPLKSRNPKKRNAPCALYRMEVTDEVYMKIKARLQHFYENAVQYRYSFIGLLLCVFHIPHCVKNRYFCSQFVSELLMSLGAARLQKQASLYLPDDFTNEPQFRLCFQGTLSGLENFSS